MSRKAVRNIHNYFKNPLVEGRYHVVPPPMVPQHIVRPDYVDNPKPQFGEYDLPPRPHTPLAIQKLRVAAKVASKALEDTKNFILEKAKGRQVLSEEDIDQFVFHNLVAQGAYPTPIGFMNFPKSVCVSVNECLVHGVPTTRPLEWGDKINIDITAYIDGYHGDNNLTVFYGEPEEGEKLQVVECAQRVLYEAIGECGPGVGFNRVGQIVQRICKQMGLHVCEQFTGHGIGHLLHMPPMVYPKYYAQYKQKMKVGSVFTIEPIISLNPSERLKIWKDGFTAISQNNPNAQFEHTILIVEDGCQVLTKRPSQKIPNPKGNIKNV